MAVSALPVIEKLEYLKGQLDTWTAVSRAIGFNRAFVWDILNGRRDPGPKLLKVLHFEKHVELVDLDPERKELAKLAAEHRR